MDMMHDTSEVDGAHAATMATNVASATATTIRDDPKQPILQWKTKKRLRRQRDDSTAALQTLQDVLQSESTIHDTNGEGGHQHSNTDKYTGPLIIPVAPDQNQWKQKQQQQQQQQKASLPLTDHTTTSSNTDDLLAVQALHDDAIRNDLNGHNGHTTATATTTNLNTISSIPTHANTFVAGGRTTTTTFTKTMLDDTDRDVQQYQKDMDALPAALEETAEAYQRVPITEFGAALLRGMGWKEDPTATTTGASSRSNSDDVMPRPHRLGLGAIPAMLPPETKNTIGVDGRRPRNVDQYQRDQRTQKQHDMYRIEREKKFAEDLQRTLQDGSIVHLVHPDHTSDNTTSLRSKQLNRARIIKLVGVPGLNMVQVQMEHTGSSVAVKRNQINGLVTRDELEHHPFRDKAVISDGPANSTKPDTLQQQPIEANAHINARPERTSSKTDKKRSRIETKEETISWVIPNIRVRIVTEKLGRRYYKEKGIVVDVTRHAGVTLKLNPSSSSNKPNGHTPDVVLDRVPERYLETALPKVGGNVIVVNPKHTNQYAKGRLIERDSKNKNYGIVQLYDDMDCIRLPLDDIAEWCGPLDDDDVMP